MNKDFIKRIVFYIFTIICSLIIFSITRFMMYLELIPSYPLFDILYIALLLSPTLLFNKPIFIKIYSYIFIFILSFIFIANSTYYEAQQTVLHFGMLKFIGEAGQVFELSYIKWYLILIFLLINIIYITLSELYFHFFKTKDSLKVSFRFCSFFFLFIFSLIGLSINYNVVYNRQENLAIDTSSKDAQELIRFETRYLRENSFSNYGFIVFYTSDFDINFTNKPCGNYTNSINEVKNPDNEYHSLLEGYNVFTIMIETGIYDLISEEYTPNLYALRSEGINFKENYNKDKTSVSELIGITGSYTLNQINYQYNSSLPNCVYDLVIDIPTSLPNMLGEDYYKSFFHDGVGLYARNNILGQLGFDSWKNEFVNVHKNGETRWNFDGSYELDSDYIDIVLNKMYKTNECFYTFYTTLSTHGPYTLSTPNVEKRLELFESMGYVDRFNEYYDKVYGKYGQLDKTHYEFLRHLTCAAMNLDEAVGKIVDKFKEVGIYDNTLFVVYGDHDCYYSESKVFPSLSKVISGSTSTSEVDQYHTTMFFTNKTLTNKFRELNNLENNELCEVSTSTSTYIIVPTILDLLGYDYDPDYYFSLSYFDFTSKYDGLFYSTEKGSFFNNIVYSTSIGKFDYVKDNVSKDDLIEIEFIQYKKLLKLLKLTDYYDQHISYKK